MYSDIFKKNTRITLFGYSDEYLKKWEREVSEYRNEESIIYLNGTPKDYTILKNKGLILLAEHMQINILGDDDFEYLKKYIRLSEIKMPLNLSKHILASKGIPPHSYDIELADINELNIQQLEFLNENGGDIRNIKLDGIKNAIFNVNDFIGLKKVIESITRTVDKAELEIKKFLQIYAIIGKNLTYNRSSNFKEAINKKLASCQGYSELLKLALNNVGIESEIIDGTYKEEGEPNFDGHVWNQVKIDGQWYNCDITWDSLNIKNGKSLRYCLRDDEFFENNKEHVVARENKIFHKVEKEYNQQFLMKIWNQNIEQER